MRNIILGSLFAGALVLLSIPASASHGFCTDWERKSSFSCVFNGRSSNVWIRQCFHVWDLTEICWDRHPSELKNDCTPWEKKTSTRCHNGSDWEQAWVRNCADSLQKTQFCSDDVDPNRTGY